MTVWQRVTVPTVQWKTTRPDNWVTVLGGAQTTISAKRVIAQTGTIAGAPYVRDIQLCPHLSISVDAAGAAGVTPSKCCHRLTGS